MTHAEAHIQDIIQDHRVYFNTGATRNVHLRKQALLRLKRAITQNESAILHALQQDLGKCAFEAFETEVAMVLDELNFMLRHVDSMARPRCVPTPIAHFPSVSRVLPQPHGLVLVMSPWNYPFLLTLAPVIGAIAAGNCVMVKPSAYAPATSALLARLLGQCLHKKHVSVVQGGRKVNQHLLQNQFDYIFFTGSVAVGKTVMAAAAQNLTPVTLELGGKSPCIVDETANVRLAAKRIMWGKCINAGQTCVAPDYVLCHKSVQASLLRWLEYYSRQLYGSIPLQSPDLARIVNQKHFARLCGLLKGTTPAFGGQTDAQALKIAPTVVADIPPDHPLMREEIFGPILPVLPFATLPQATNFIKARPSPLALYLFTQSPAARRTVLDTVPFGGGCVNDTIVHLASPHMPFGGVGHSGMGSYHGKASFATFSHHKSVLHKSNLVDVPLRYPPYSAMGLAVLKMIFR